MSNNLNMADFILILALVAIFVMFLVERHTLKKIKDKKLYHIKVKKLDEGKKDDQIDVRQIESEIVFPPEASSWDVSEIEQHLEEKIKDEELRRKLALKFKEFFEKESK